MHGNIEVAPTGIYQIERSGMADVFSLEKSAFLAGAT